MPEIMHPEPTTNDTVEAIAGSYCPFCGSDEVTRARIGVRTRCRSCLGRWEQYEYSIVQVPHPDLAAPQPSYEPIERPTHVDKLRAIEVIEAEVEQYMKNVKASSGPANKR